MAEEKKTLSMEEHEEQTVMELPDRELLATNNIHDNVVGVGVAVDCANVAVLSSGSQDC